MGVALSFAWLVDSPFLVCKRYSLLIGGLCVCRCCMVRVGSCAVQRQHVRLYIPEATGGNWRSAVAPLGTNDGGGPTPVELKRSRPRPSGQS
jgi:hypothetical protein